MQNIPVFCVGTGSENRLPDIERVGVSTGTGRVIALRDLVRFDPGNAPLQISRNSRQRILQVSADVTDRDLGGVVRDLQEALSGQEWPSGFGYRIVGDWEEQQKSFDELTRGLVLAVVLMYMVMASQFESFRDPLVILVTIPLGAIGVILALLLTGTTLNAQSFIGTVMLAGIVVNNAIVLVDFVNQLRRRGLSIDEALLEAGQVRLRPILMTTSTTVLGLVPMAIGIGEGAEIRAPMAITVIGGLIASTLVTLVLVPLIYTTLESFVARVFDLFGRSVQQPVAEEVVET